MSLYIPTPNAPKIRIMLHRSAITLNMPTIRGPRRTKSLHKKQTYSTETQRASSIRPHYPSRTKYLFKYSTSKNSTFDPRTSPHPPSAQPQSSSSFKTRTRNRYREHTYKPQPRIPDAHVRTWDHPGTLHRRTRNPAVWSRKESFEPGRLHASEHDRDVGGCLYALGRQKRTG